MLTTGELAGNFFERVTRKGFQYRDGFRHIDRVACNSQLDQACDINFISSLDKALYSIDHIHFTNFVLQEPEGIIFFIEFICFRYCPLKNYGWILPAILYTSLAA